MSPGNAEVVRSIYDRWSRGDFHTGDAMDPLVLFVMPEDFPDSGNYVGVDALSQYTRHLLEPWVRLTIEAEELHESGDSVFAAVLQRGVGQGSGVDAEFRYFQVWTLRGGRVIRLENFRDRGQARAAAGLEG